MQRINRGIDTTGVGTARQLCIAGLISLLFLLATGTYALAVDCSICHYPGGIAPLPHDTGCQNTSCLQSCHTQDHIQMGHPPGPGTPLTGDRDSTCRTCHDKPFPGVYHPYRINTSAGSITPAGFVDLDQACGQCHGGGLGQAKPGIPYYTKDALAAYAVNTHTTTPVPQFTFAYDPVTSLKVNFDASGTTCPSGTGCTYSWDFGDTGTGAGITTTHTYVNTQTRTVVLTVNDPVNVTSASTSKVVVPVSRNVAPVAGIGTITKNNLLVSFNDASTDDAGAGSLTIKVNWGDGSNLSTGVGGGPFSHTYANAGTFTITLTATDSEGLFNSATTPVTVPEKYTVSGTIFDSDGATPLSGALVVLKQGGLTKGSYTTAANGVYTFANVSYGIYDIQVTKSGMVFDGDPAAGYQNPVTVNVTANLTRNFTRLAPVKVTVTVTPALSGVAVFLKQGVSTKYSGVTNAAGQVVFNSVLPATYNVQLSKSSYAFDGDPVAPGNQNPYAVTVGPADTTVPFTRP